MKDQLKDKIIEILEVEIVCKAMPLVKVKPLAEIAEQILELFKKEKEDTSIWKKVGRPIKTIK